MYSGDKIHIPSLENATWLKGSGPFPRGNQTPPSSCLLRPLGKAVCPVGSKPDALSSCRLRKAGEIHLVFGGHRYFRLHPLNVPGPDRAHDTLPRALPSPTPFGTRAQLNAPKRFFPNPVVFPAVLTSCKLCNSWSIPVIARYKNLPHSPGKAGGSPHLAQEGFAQPFPSHSTGRQPLRRGV